MRVNARIEKQQQRREKIELKKTDTCGVTDVKQTFPHTVTNKDIV